MITLRKRKTQPDMETSITEKKARFKSRNKFADSPEVYNLKDLIKVSKSLRFYKNLDIESLWRLEPWLEELDKMVGMDSLKETIFFQVIYYLQGMHTKNKNEEYLHTVIYGPPGSGKTTVAKIIGKIYQSLNVLSPNGVFKVAYRDDFIAGYLGQTATKTKKLLQSCIGGILFIDEVYALAPRSNDRDSFSKEAIDTLNAFLSDHKNDFCCIVAGYQDDVENCFFSMNQGLKRRFPWVHKIEEYKSRDLYNIFIKMVNDMNWKVDFEPSFMIDILEKKKDLFKYAGGSLETMLSKAKMLHAVRVFTMDKEHKFILTKDDINKAIEYIEKNEKREEDKAPEYMYM